MPYGKSDEWMDGLSDNIPTIRVTTVYWTYMIVFAQHTCHLKLNARNKSYKHISKSHIVFTCRVLKIAAIFPTRSLG